nr:restriction endonuclease subunit S [Bacteroidota bacterium]
MSQPEIRFPEFKDDWEHKELNELLSESKKKNTDLKFSKDEVLSVSGEMGIVNQIEHLGRSYAGESVHNYGVVEVGNIVYTKSPLKANPYGIIKINKGKAGIVSTLYAVYKVNSKTAYGEFLDYYFSLDANTNRYLRPLVRKGAKNDMKINNEYVLHDRIFAPIVTEQKRITYFFSVIDNKINQLKEKKALLEEYKKGMMQKIFSQEIWFKQENGKDFPDWEERRLGEIADINPKNGKLPKSFIYIDLESVVKGLLNIKERVSVENAPSRAQRILKSNDILFQMVRPYQRNNYFFDIESTDYVASTGYAQIRTKNNTSFLYQLLHTDDFVNKVVNKCTGTGYPAINSSDLSKINISFPSIPEQNKIANFLSKIDEKIKTVNEQIEETKAYKKGLLQSMFCV